MRGGGGEEEGGGGGIGDAWGARVSEFFFTKDPNLKDRFFLGGGERVGVGGGVDGWTDEQAQTDLPL